MKWKCSPSLLPDAPFPRRSSTLPVILRNRHIYDLSKDETALADALRRRETGDGDEPEPGVCPFRGLEAFREEDSDFFFGREPMVQRLLEKLRHHNLLAVLGPSGSGKSSVVRAGLIPRLRADGAMIGICSPGNDPLEELVFCLRRMFGRAGRTVHSERLMDRLANNRNALHYIILELKELACVARVVIVIDQFEELFTLCSRNEIESYLTSLGGALEHGRETLSIVMTMRTDFLGHCAAYEDLNDLISDHCVQVGAMNREALKQTIIEPCRRSGLELEPGLVRQMLEDVIGSSVELPLLQHALLELYEARTRRTLTMKAYGAIGGIEGALARRANAEFEALDEHSRITLRKMFTICLVHSGEGAEDTRRRATLDELRSIGRSEVVDRLINRWTEVRLLVSHRDEGRDMVLIDVAHEALIRRWDRLAAWMAEDRETARRIQRLRHLARSWAESGKDPDLLSRGAPLQQLEELLANEYDHLGSLARNYIAACLAERERKEQRREALRKAELAAARQKTRNTRLLAIFFMGLVFIFASFMWHKEREANKQREIAVQMSGFFKGLLRDMRPTIHGHSKIDVEKIMDLGLKQLADRQLKPVARAGLLDTMGNVYIGLSRFEKARPLLEEALDLRRQHLGIHHIDTARSFYSLGRLNQELEHHDLARQYFQQTLAIARTLFGSDHRMVADPINDIAAILHETGHLQEAEAMYREALVIYRRINGEESPTVAITLNNLGLLLKVSGRYEEAEATYREALAMNRKVFGEQHTNTSLPLNNLGGLLHARGRLKEAESIYLRTLAINRNAFGDLHQDVALALSNLGRVLQDAGRLQEAEDRLNRALEIDRQLSGDTNVRIGKRLAYLADIKNDREQFDLAEASARKAISVYEKTLPEDHWRFDEVRSILGTALAGQRQYKQAAVLLKISHRNLTRKLNPNNTRAVRAERRIHDFNELAGENAISLINQQ